MARGMGVKESFSLNLQTLSMAHGMSMWKKMSSFCKASVHHTMEVEFFNFYPKKLVWSQNKRHMMATAHKLKNKTKENTTIQGTGSFFLWYPTRAHGCEEKKEKRIKFTNIVNGQWVWKKMSSFYKANNSLGSTHNGGAVS